MHAIILALTLTAPPGWTEQQWNGIEKTLAQVKQSIDAGTKATKVRPTKLHLGANVGKSAVCAQVMGFYVAPELAAKLGADPAIYTATVTSPDGTTSQVPSNGKLYAVATICGAPTSQRAERTPLLDTAVASSISAPFSSGPGQDAFQIAFPADTEAQAAFQCGCSTGANCTWKGQPAPKDQQLQPGTFSGTGCVRMTCDALFGFEPMPDACR